MNVSESDKIELINTWNYYCSLCDMLSNTTQYIDHSRKTNRTVNSNEFQKILILTASEFENVCKQICLIINPKCNIDKIDIIDITNTIISKYPKIKDIEINSNYDNLKPLNQWNTQVINNSGKKTTYKLIGLPWWKDYNNVKHNRSKNYLSANLENTINGLASLMIMEIVYFQLKTQSLNITDTKKCSYFYHKYGNHTLTFTDNRLSNFL